MFPQSLLEGSNNRAKAKQNEEEELRNRIMNQIMNNITSMVTYHQTDYYLMIKKQANQNFSYIFLTDYDQTFWLEKISYQYLVELKQQMKIQTSLLAFTEYLAEGLKKKVEIAELFPEATLKVSLKLIEGLTINAIIPLKVSISQNSQPDEHLLLLKAFFRQYFAIKQSHSENRILQPYKRAEKEDHKKTIDIIKKSDSIYMEPNGQMANRDLINPLRKKRKGFGMKFQEGHSNTIERKSSLNYDSYNYEYERSRSRDKGNRKPSRKLQNISASSSSFESARSSSYFD